MLTAAAEKNAASQYIPNPTAPKEIGLMQRIEGTVGSLDNLEAKLSGFISRLSGQGIPVSDAPERVRAPGIESAISCAEDKLRRLHQLVDGLDAAF